MASQPKYRILRKTLGAAHAAGTGEELFAGESHRAFLTVIGIVLPAEADLGFGERNNPMVRDGDAMGITSQVLQDVVWSAKGWFGIDDPILLKQGS